MVPCRLRVERRAPQGRRGRRLSEVEPETPPVALAGALADRAIRIEPVGVGLTAARCAIVGFDDGTTAFVKQATDDASREQVLDEAETLLALDGRHAPRLLDVLDDGATIVVTDLSHAQWSPPLPPADDVFAALAATSIVAPPGRLRAMRRSYDPWDDLIPPWWIADPRWWRTALPALRDASLRARFDGDALVHGDATAGNVCALDGRVVLVDWADAARGSLDWGIAIAALAYRVRGLDVAAPLRDPAPVVATLAGFATREYLALANDTSAEPRALRIRTGTTARFAGALAWAAELLGLDAPAFGPPLDPER